MRESEANGFVSKRKRNQLACALAASRRCDRLLFRCGPSRVGPRKLIGGFRLETLYLKIKMIRKSIATRPNRPPGLDYLSPVSSPIASLTVFKMSFFFFIASVLPSASPQK